MLKISEIFFSYQGEGIYIGTPTVFIRLSGCNLKCFYCDTKYASILNNKKKYSVSEVFEKVKKLMSKHKPAMVSLTGGEPLLHSSNEIIKLLEKIKSFQKKILIYLESNSTLPEKLKDIIKYLDVICINIKPETKLYHKYYKTISLCKENQKKFFIKITITPKKTNTATIKKFIKIIPSESSVVLQPESISYKNRDKQLFFNLSLWHKVLLNKVKTISIVPQLHKFVWKVK